MEGKAHHQLAILYKKGREHIYHLIRSASALIHTDGTADRNLRISLEGLKGESDPMLKLAYELFKGEAKGDVTLEADVKIVCILAYFAHISEDQRWLIRYFNHLLTECNGNKEVSEQELECLVLLSAILGGRLGNSLLESELQMPQFALFLNSCLKPEPDQEAKVENATLENSPEMTFSL